MTDNEIIKALECCTDTNEMSCNKQCPLYDYDGGCWCVMKYKVFDLINRQQAEIKRLKNENEQCHCKECKYCERVADAIISCEELLCCTYYPNNHSTTPNAYCSNGEKKEGERDDDRR